MKNVLIGLLAIGLGVSLYFNYKNCSASKCRTSAGKMPDATTVYFYAAEDNSADSSGSGGSSSGKEKKVSMTTREGLIDSLGNISLKVCCPIPPDDTTKVTANTGNGAKGMQLSLSGLSRIEIKVPASVKRP